MESIVEMTIMVSSVIICCWIIRTIMRPPQIRVIHRNWKTLDLMKARLRIIVEAVTEEKRLTFNLWRVVQITLPYVPISKEAEYIELCHQRLILFSDNEYIYFDKPLRIMEIKGAEILNTIEVSRINLQLLRDTENAKRAKLPKGLYKAVAKTIHAQAQNATKEAAAAADHETLTTGTMKIGITEIKITETGIMTIEVSGPETATGGTVGTMTGNAKSSATIATRKDILSVIAEQKGKT